MQDCIKFDASSNDCRTTEYVNHAYLNGLVRFCQTIKLLTRMLQVLLDCNLLALKVSVSQRKIKIAPGINPRATSEGHLWQTAKAVAATIIMKYVLRCAFIRRRLFFSAVAYSANNLLAVANEDSCISDASCNCAS